MVCSIANAQAWQGYNYTVPLFEENRGSVLLHQCLSGESNYLRFLSMCFSQYGTVLEMGAAEEVETLEHSVSRQDRSALDEDSP
jgi:hypothetical protein